MLLFILVGLLFLQCGRHSRDSLHVHYDMTIACLDRQPIPADIIIKCSPTQSVLQDNTAAFVIGRTFVPSRSERSPILLDALQVSLIPGDPDQPSYERHLPSFPVPVIITQGSVASASSTDLCVTLSFPLTFSNYVCSSIRRSTVLSILYQCAPILHTRLITMTT